MSNSVVVTCLFSELTRGLGDSRFAQGVIFRHCAESGPRSTYFWAQVKKQADCKRQEWIVHSPGKVGINRIIISAIGLGLPSRSALSYRT